MSPASRSPHHEPLGWGAALFNLLLAILWGGTAVTARDAVDYVPPLAVGGIRFGLAAIFMLGWCRWEGVSIGLRRGQFRASFWMGLLLFLQIATFNWGVAWSNSSHASLLVNTYIFWVAGWEHWVQRAIRLNRWQALGLLIAAIGAAVLLLEAPAESATAHQSGALVSTPRDEVTLSGDLLLTLSAVLLAIKVVYTKEAVRSVPPGTLILWHDIIGAAMFFALSAAVETWPTQPWTPRVTISLLYAGFIVSGFCFAGHAWMLRRHSASSVSVFSFATPVFGVALGVLLRGDLLSTWLIASGVLVACGIVLVNAGATAPDTDV